MPTRGPAEPSFATRGLAVWGEAYLLDLRRRNYSEGTHDQAQRVLAEVFRFLRSRRVRDVRRVRERHLVSYLATVARRPGMRGPVVCASTRSTYTGVLRRFFAFLERRGVVLESPARNLTQPRARTLPRAVPSEAAVRALLATPPETLVGRRDRAILELLYGTGIRIGECGRVDCADLDLAGQLLVRNGKGRKDRMVPLPALAAEAMRRYLHDVRPSLVHDETEPALFLSTFGTRLKRGTLYVIVKGHVRAAGLALSPHGLRHAYATHLLARGVDVRYLQQLLGHAQINTTAIYTRVDVSALRDVIRRAHPRGRARSRRIE